METPQASLKGLYSPSFFTFFKASVYVDLEKVDIFHTKRSPWSPLKGIIERTGLWLKSKVGEPENNPFFRVRFRWWRPFDLDGFARDQGEKYEIDIRPVYIDRGGIDIFGDARREFWVRADTLNAFITAYKAILFQKKTVPLTPLDRELLDYILENYTRSRDTPLI